MKRYRRLIIIFMMVVINVLVTKSKQLMFEKAAQDIFIKEVANTAFKIKYDIANNFYNLGIKNVKKAHSKGSFIQFIYPQKKKEYYDSAIANMICAVTIFSECARDFLLVMDGVRKDKKKDISMVQSFGIRGSLILGQTYIIAAELVDAIEKRRALEEFYNYAELEQKFGDLIKDMREYEKRINTISEKCRVSAASRHSQVNHRSWIRTSDIGIIEC